MLGGVTCTRVSYSESLYITALCNGLPKIISCGGADLLKHGVGREQEGNTENEDKAT